MHTTHFKIIIATPPHHLTTMRSATNDEEAVSAAWQDFHAAIVPAWEDFVQRFKVREAILKECNIHSERFEEEAEAYGDDEEDALECILDANVDAYHVHLEKLQGLGGDPAKERTRQAVLKTLVGLSGEANRDDIVKGLRFVKENVEDCA